MRQEEVSLQEAKEHEAAGGRVLTRFMTYEDHGTKDKPKMVKVPRCVIEIADEPASPEPEAPKAKAKKQPEPDVDTEASDDG